MTYSFLKNLLEAAEEFERTLPGTTLPTEAAFGQWLLTRAGTTSTLPAEVRRRPPNRYETPESEISTLLTFMYRYVRGYARQALEGSPLTTFDDFTYLAVLLDAEPGALTKSELTERNIQEKATGVEVIRRLLAKGYVTETPHPTDKRAKHLRLTDAGREVLFAAFGPMSQVARLGAGTLNAHEKQLLLRLLRKLDHFHHPIFLTARTEPVNELLTRHLPAPDEPPA